MPKQKLIKMLFYKKFNKKEDKNIFNYINNILIPRLKNDNVIVSKFINKLVNDSNDYSCDILHNILYELYRQCGYQKYKYKYKYKYFVLDIDKKRNKFIKNNISIN